MAPPPPTLDVAPKVVECKLQTGETGKCITFWGPDYAKVEDYIDALVVEIERACIEIGQVTLPPGWTKGGWLKALAERKVKSACHAPAE